MQHSYLRLCALVIFFTAILSSSPVQAQSDNCATATAISIPSTGTACVNGTTANGTVDNITTTCNGTAVNFVWYQFTSTGTQNSITLTPGTLQNAVLVVDATGCSDNQIDFCNTATGSNPITILNSQPVGTTILISIASTSNTQGTFSLCVNSYTPTNPSTGDDCTNPVPYCNSSSTLNISNMSSFTGSGKPSCFIGPGSNPTQDMFISFTVYSAGTIAWTGNPSSNSTEFDWALWNITSGCPGSQVSCNYNYDGQSGGNFGQAGNSNSGEFNATTTGVVGNTYVIQISNWSGNGTGFAFSWQGTAAIAPTASLSISPTFSCGTSATVNITNLSTGTPNWTFGNGNTYTGTNPPAQTYTATGTYPITATIPGACPSTNTQYFSLYGPLAATATSTSVTCSGLCNGTASVSTVSGGNGIYTYSWTPGGSTSSSVSGLCAGTYTVKVSNAFCGTSVTNTVNVIAPPALTVTVNSPTICKGASTTLTAGGATTYSWTPSTGLSATTGASVTANPTVTTTYTVVGTTGSCTAAATAVVTVNPTPTLTVNSPTLCAGNSATLTAGGASTYTWAPAGTLSASTGTSVTASPTTTTVYTITGTAVSTCTAVASATVTVNPTPTVTVNSATICAGQQTATLSAGGASTYTWSPSTGLSSSTGASVTANPTVTTTYTVTGTSAGSCTAAATSVVTVNATPTVTVNSATMCPGNSTTLNASGANTYTWAPAGTLSASTGSSVTASPTVTTTYTITASSVAGCTATATSTVVIGGSIVPTVNNATICTGNSASLTANGGTTYTWSPASGLSSTSGASVTASPTVTTTYTITAASGGCTGTTTAAVTVNPLPTVSVNSPSVCAGNSVTLTASGASTYSWSPTTGLSAGTGASVAASPTATTTYTVTGASASSCTSTAIATVTVMPVPTVTVNSATYCTGGSATLTAGGAGSYTWSPATGLSSTSGASVTANPTVTTNYTVTGSSAGCANTATTSVTVITNPTVTVASATICTNSSATLSASGASTYSWSPATGLSATSGTSVTANPGTTTVYTITGSAGTCSAVTTATVTVNTLPVISVNSGTICAGQTSSTLTAGGANTYTWSPATGLSSANGSPVVANPASTSSYTVTGTDANGCVNSATTAVTVNPLPAVSVNSDLICVGGSTTLTATGATSYTWNPSGGLSASSGASVTASPAATSSYTVTGTDLNGCYNSAVATVTVVSNPTVTVNSATICAGQQTATLTANGASAYAWSPSTGLSASSGSVVTGNPTATTVYTITGTVGTCTAVSTATITVNPLPVVTVTSGTICAGQTSATLAAGGATTYTWSPATGLSSANGSPVTASPASTSSYTVTGTDANGCVNSAATTVTVNALPAVAVNSDLICVGGSTTLTATGAATYTWNPSGGLSASSGATVTANPPSTSSYTVTGTDVNGCFNTAVSTVTVVANPTVTVNSASICAGQQTATLSASGASNYNWSPATGLSASTGSLVIANPSVTTVYTVTGTAGTCTAVATSTVTVNPLPLITAGSNSPVCVNQAISLTANGGVSYTWSGPNSFSSSQANETIASATLADAGNYIVSAADANGCVNSDTVTVVVNPLPVVIAAGATVCVSQTINLSCNNSGTIYSWMGPNNFSSNQQNPSIAGATSAMAGNYVVTVTDLNGCTSGNVANVVVNPSLAINATGGTVCENGTLALSADAGVSWTWSGPNGFASNQQSPVITNATPGASGTYTVTGTDANGCTGTATATAVVNPLPVLSVNSATICLGQQTATLTASGAATYTWTPALTLSSNTGNPVTATPLINSTYTVTGTDANGCSGAATATVTVNALPVITVGSSTICEGGSTPLSANGAVSYTWMPGGSLSSTTGSAVTATPTVSTTYSVVGSDANGCYNFGIGLVLVNPLPVVAVNSASICNGSSATLSATGANTYAWSPSAGLSSASGASVTASSANTSTYIVTGTDINGCSNTATAVVTVNPLPVLSVGPAMSSGCAPLCVAFTNSASATGSYTWDFGDGVSSSAATPSHCYTVQGTYNATLTLTDGNGCVGTGSATVVVYPVPNADFTFNPQPATVFEPTINFYDNSGGAIISGWSWNFGDSLNSTSSAQNPVFTYGDAGDYNVQLTVTSSYGCVDSVTKTVVVEPDFALYVPNAFTPNFDGTNDVFMAKGVGIKEFSMYIFDRWGNMVFYSEKLSEGWDGRFKSKGDEILQEDVYVWKIEAKSFKNEKKQLKGTVSLVK
jgi:gliding motility-associated-like protein